VRARVAGGRRVERRRRERGERGSSFLVFDARA
jgi:hypothetical protein